MSPLAPKYFFPYAIFMFYYKNLCSPPLIVHEVFKEEIHFCEHRLAVEDISGKSQEGDNTISATIRENQLSGTILHPEQKHEHLLALDQIPHSVLHLGNRENNNCGCPGCSGTELLCVRACV